MGDARAEDLLSLDRDVARGWRALEHWRAALARDPDAHADEEALEPVRSIAGKAMWHALAELTPSVAEAPLRDALMRWVLALTHARIGRPDEVAWARAVSEVRALVDRETPRLVCWREAWRGVVAARTTTEAGMWLATAAEIAPALAELRRTSAGRRVEVARRLGGEHPWAPLAPIGRMELRDLAARLLDATEDLSRAVWKDALGEQAGVAGVLHAAVAREAGEGWPARLTMQWLDEAFGAGLRGLHIEPSPLPSALGASSFARALCAFGFAMRVASTPSSMPFALSREPAFVAAHRLGFVFGALAANPVWQGRVLGVGRRVAFAQSRVLARSALLDARLHAARVLLGDEAALAPRDRFDEVGARLFVRGLDPRFRGAWPGAREDEPARFIALLESGPFADSLRDRFDSDWFRNPRAWAHLRAGGVAPAREPVDTPALAAHVDGLARAFEGALG
jgi:hypothetical protein